MCALNEGSNEMTDEAGNDGWLTWSLSFVATTLTSLTRQVLLTIRVDAYEDKLLSYDVLCRKSGRLPSTFIGFWFSITRSIILE